jgi:hypothetical protein
VALEEQGFVEYSVLCSMLERQKLYEIQGDYDLHALKPVHLTWHAGRHSRLESKEGMRMNAFARSLIRALRWSM